MELLYRVIYLSFLIGSFTFALHSFRMIVLSIASKAYRRANCEKILVQYRVHEGAVTNFSVYYSFIVENKIYTGGRLCHGVPSRKLLEKYRSSENSKHKTVVYYSPIDPHRNVLSPSVAMSSVAGFTFFATCFLFLSTIWVSGNIEVFFRLIEIEAGIGGSP